MAHLTRALAILGVATVVAFVHSWVVPITLDAPPPAEEARQRLQDLVHRATPPRDPARPPAPGEQMTPSDPTDAHSPQESASHEAGEPLSSVASEPAGGAGHAAEPAADAISLEDLRTLYDEHIVPGTGLVILIDARGREGAYQEGHIVGAEHLTADMLLDADPRGLEIVSMLMPEQTIVIYCGGGDCDESRNLRTLLVNEFGFENVWIFHEGYPALVEADFPVVSGDSPIG